jgi:hypothetical protein
MSIPDRMSEPGVALGVAPPGAVHQGTRGLLVAFALLTGLAVHQLVVLADSTERWWPWTITIGATGGFLAAAYAAGLLLSLAALRQTSWRRVRVAVATVAVFTGLTLLATLVHAHKLHIADPDLLARGTSWTWFVIYLVVPVVCIRVLSAQAGPARPLRTACTPLPRWLRTVLVGQGLALGGLGVITFASGLTVHHGTPSEFWPWPLTPLSAMVIGAWLIALAVGTALVLRDGDLGELEVPALTSAAFGVLQLVSLVLHRADLTETGAPLWIFVAVLVAMTASGGYGWRAARDCRQAPQRLAEDRPTGSASASASAGGASTARLAKNAVGLSSAASRPVRWAGAGSGAEGSAAGSARPHSLSTSSSSASR